MRAPPRELKPSEVDGSERLGGVKVKTDGTPERVIAAFSTLILAADRIREASGQGRPVIVVGQGAPTTEAPTGSVYIDAISGDLYQEA